MVEPTPRSKRDEPTYFDASPPSPPSTLAQDLCTRRTDGLLVGTDAIFTSANVTFPKNLNEPVPTPSIYTDARGEIHNCLVGGTTRINLLHTTRGVMRSGDIHRNVQLDFVFSGKVEVWTLTKDGTTAKVVYGPLELIEIPAAVPHIFHFLEDSIIAEWWKPGPFRAWFYLPYRSVVEKSFVELQMSSVGDDSSHRNQPRLAVLTESSDRIDEDRHTPNQARLWWGCGALVFLAFTSGFIVGRKWR